MTRSVGAAQVRAAVQSTLEAWLPTYIADAERRAGLAARTIDLPRSWRRLARFDTVAADQLPAVFVTSPGIEVVERRGSGEHDATWRIAVTAVARGRTFEETADLVGYYTAAVRAALIQHAAHGIGATTRWDDESYDAVAVDAQRTLGAGVVEVLVTVRNVIDAHDADVPATPPADPYATPAAPVTVTRTNVDLTR